MKLGCFSKSSSLVSLLKTERIRRRFSIALRTESLILSELSCMIHWINEVIPYSLEKSGWRMVATRSIKICLSVLNLFGSFRPGESIMIRFSYSTFVQCWVTVLIDLEALNSGGGLSPFAKNSAKIYETFVSSVDLPYPHSPRTQRVKGFSFTFTWICYASSQNNLSSTVRQFWK